MNLVFLRHANLLQGIGVHKNGQTPIKYSAGFLEELFYCLGCTFLFKGKHLGAITGLLSPF